MTTRPTVRAANGLVASGHHLATAAGLAALRDGGSAADAAVTAAAVCAVVLPQRTSIGGDLFALVYDARAREVSAYNASGAAPRSLALDRFVAGYPEQGAIVATVPGVIGGWAELLADHGRLGLERALAPAIAYAEDGFPVSDRLAERFVRGVATAGGAIAREDLAAFRVDRPDPLAVEYRGLRVFGQPPVSQGHILLEELAIAEGLGLGGYEWGGADLVHLMVETKKAAFADRDAHAGDPALTGFDAARLLDPEYIAARRRAVTAKAADRVEAGAFAAADTTYLAVVDRDGNAVSLIESVFSAFGSACVVPGTGILLNNRLIGFSLDPRSPNPAVPLWHARPARAGADELPARGRADRSRHGRTARDRGAALVPRVGPRAADGAALPRSRAQGARRQGSRGRGGG